MCVGVCYICMCLLVFESILPPHISICHKPKCEEPHEYAQTYANTNMQVLARTSVHGRFLALCFTLLHSPLLHTRTNMHTHTYTHVHTHTHAHTHARAQTHANAYAYAHTHTYIHAHTRTHTHACKKKTMLI